MSERPHFSIGPRQVAGHFGTRKALQVLALRLLKLRPVVLLARSATPTSRSFLDMDGVRPVTLADAELFARAGFPGMVERKLADGPGWLMLDHGRLVAWCFLALTHSEIADWLIMRTSNAKSLWGAGTWVHRDYRGSGLAGKVRDHSFTWYRDNGYREQLTWINLANPSSLRSSYKLGARAVGRITFIRLFGVTLVYDGRQWHLGRWTASNPLVLSMENIRRDRAATVDERATASPSALRRG